MSKSKTLCLADLMKKETKGINPMKQREGLDKPSSSFLFKNQTDNKQITNGYQTDNKQITNGYQTDNKRNTEKEKRITQGIAIRYQTDNKTDNKRITDFKVDTLVGHEKKLLLFITKECSFTGDFITPPITNERIREFLGCSMDTAKMIVYRLVKKGFINRHESKTGRGGWIKFGMPKSLYQNLKQITNGQQTDNKQITQGITQGITTLSSSSSNTILDNNTTTEDAWFKIDITPLEKIGVTNTHIKQIINSNKSSPALLQKSIEYFVYMLENKTQDIREPLLFFMKVMRNEGAISKPVGYKTQLERNLETYEQEKKAEENKIREIVEKNYEILLMKDFIKEKAEELLKTSNGMLNRDSKAFKASMQGLIINKLITGEISL